MRSNVEHTYPIVDRDDWFQVHDHAWQRRVWGSAKVRSEEKIDKRWGRAYA